MDPLRQHTDAAQIEGEQITAGQEPIIPSPRRSDFDDISEMPRIKNENHTSESPGKERNSGLRRSERKRIRTAGDKEDNEASLASPSSSLLIGSRVFTEEDEIVILKGMIDYGLSYNVSASLIGLNDLHEFLKGKLHSDFTKTQIYGKIRRLKKKFGKNLEIGGDPVLLKPHEATVFELSKNIWGGNDVGKGYSTNNHAKDRILEDNNNTKKKSSRGKNNVTTNDGEGHDDDDGDDEGKGKVPKYEVKDGDEFHKDVMRKRLQKNIEIYMRKLELQLELAKLESDEMKKG